MSGDNQQVRDMILKRSLLGGFWHVYDKNNRYYENVLNPSLLENTGLVNNDNLFSLSATDLNVQLLRSLREALKHSTSIMNVLLPPEVGNVKKLKNRKKFFECITKAIDADLGAMASTSLCIFRPFDCESLQIALSERRLRNSGFTNYDQNVFNFGVRYWVHAWKLACISPPKAVLVFGLTTSLALLLQSISLDRLFDFCQEPTNCRFAIRHSEDFFYLATEIGPTPFLKLMQIQRILQEKDEEQALGFLG